MIADAQLHVWEDDSPERPWNREFARSRGAFLASGDPFTAEQALTEMDRVGIDCALLVSFLLYDDVGYVLDAVRRYPNRFAAIAQVDLDGDDPLSAMRSHVHDPYVVGVRLAFSRARSDVYRRLADGALDPLIALAVAAGIPVMITAAGRADVIGAVARTFPRGRFIVDHMGVHQSLDGTSSVDPLAGFDKVLGLASLDNVAVKITGAPTLSRAGYPFDDLRAPIRCLLDRFTPERVIWGSDYSRIRLSHTLDVALDWIRLADWLSDAEKEWMLGRALASVIALPG